MIRSSEKPKVIVIKHAGDRIIEARVYMDEQDLHSVGTTSIRLAGDALIELVISLLRNVRAEIQLKQEG